jgi:beta-galactosidase/beta-glucuronidase
MNGHIEISINDVDDVEACIVATYVDSQGSVQNGPVTMTGQIRGPYCDGSRTLPAKIEFRASKRRDAVQVEAILPDPCLWSLELPHVYHVEVEARRAGQLVAEYHGQIGLRRSQARQRDILIPKRSDEDRRH